VAGGPGRSARVLVHPLTEVLEPLLRDVDVGLRQGAGPLLQCVEEDEEVAGPLVQDPIEVSPVVAAQLPELPVDLRAVREREGRVVPCRPCRGSTQPARLVSVRAPRLNRPVRGTRPNDRYTSSKLDLSVTVDRDDPNIGTGRVVADGHNRSRTHSRRAADFSERGSA